MMGPTHRLVGATAGFVASNAVGLPIAADLCFGAIAGAASSLPDDLERWLRLSHRKLTHRPALQWLVIATLAYAALHWHAASTWIVLGIAGAVAFGCLMHSVADAMTVDPDGVELFWPIYRRGVHVLPRWARIWVGSKSRSELVFCVVWVWIVLCYLYVQFGHTIRA